MTLGYDAVGNRTEASMAQAARRSLYDLLEGRTTAIDPAGNAITYTYDAVGNRATMTAPNGGVFTYAYGARGQIADLVNPKATARRSVTTRGAGGR